MSSPVVSIITPVFNRASFLANLFACIDAQTLQDFEHIVVDDKSTDDGPQMLQKRAEQHRRTRYMANGYKKGVSGARNFGLDNATGTYVALLDSDDGWEPDHLQAAVTFLDAYPEVSFYFTNRLMVDQNNTVLDSFFGHLRLIKEMPTRVIDEDFRIAELAPMKIFLRGNPVTTSSVLIRRSMLGDIRFDENLALTEDRDFWIRVAMESGGKMAFRMAPVVRYMRHPGGTMSDSHTFGIRWMAAQLALYDRCESRYKLDADERRLLREQRRKVRGEYAYHLWHDGRRLRGLTEYVRSRF